MGYGYYCFYIDASHFISTLDFDVDDPQTRTADEKRLISDFFFYKIERQRWRR